MKKPNREYNFFIGLLVVLIYLILGESFGHLVSLQRFR